MTGAELERVFRLRFFDKVADYFVKQDDFYLYLNEAQDEAAERADLLFDKKSVTLAVGQTIYKPSDIITVITSAYVGNNRLFITDRVELDRLDPDWRNAASGDIRYLIHYDKQIELTPAPSQETTLQLEYFRLPKDPVTSDSEPEIHRANHVDLLDWVLYRAYNVPDPDTFNPQRAEQFLAKFTLRFGQRPSATLKKRQYSNVPQHNVVYMG